MDVNGEAVKAEIEFRSSRRPRGRAEPGSTSTHLSHTDEKGHALAINLNDLLRGTMRSGLFLSLLLGSVLSAASAQAGAILLAQGALTGSAAGLYTDLSGLTGTLENGVSASLLGGIGSGLAYAGGTTFVGVPDRGPNAVSYNAAVDNTVSYISRIQTLDMALTPNAAPGALPFTLTPTLTGTTLLYSSTTLAYGSGASVGLGSGAPAQNTASQYYFTGRSDNYGVGDSGAAANGRLDPESIRVSNDGKTVFISDEYGPYVRQFDRATGELLRTYTLPANLNVTNLSPVGQTEIDNNTVGRVANKGMEGLALTPDGKTLVGIMQAQLEQDTGQNVLRIVTIDVATGETHEYGYALGPGSGVSDIVAINDHQFLVDERDGKGLGDGSKAKVKQIFEIDISGAADITDLSGAAAAAEVVSKNATPFVDLVAALTAHGVTAAQIPAKIEGIAFGQDVTYDNQLYHTLFVANDNDFVADTAGPNRFYVFGFQDGDLPGFVAQQFSAVPEPASWAMMILGVAGVGGLLRSRRRLGLKRRAGDELTPRRPIASRAACPAGDRLWPR